MVAGLSFLPIGYGPPCGPSVSIIWILKFTIPKRARATRRAGIAGRGGTRCGRYRIRAQSSPPRCRPRGRGRASVDVRCPGGGKGQALNSAEERKKGTSLILRFSAGLFRLVSRQEPLGRSKEG